MQYSFSSMWGGIGLISVPNSCSILYLYMHSDKIGYITMSADALIKLLSCISINRCK